MIPNRSPHHAAAAFQPTATTAPTGMPCALRLLCSGIALACAGPALAAAGQEAGTPASFADVQDVPHTIRPGDTLEGLARRYAGDRRVWTQLGKLNQVRDPRRLQPGAVLRIPASLLPRESADVAFAQGDVSMVQPDGSKRPLDAAPGSRLPEGARLQVGPAAAVSLRLADGTLIRVRPASDVQLLQLRRRGSAGSVQSVLGVRGGGVESAVTPRPAQDRRFEVRTPTATTSVRGTHFRVDLAPSGDTLTSVDDGSVAVQPPSAAASAPPAALLTHGQGVAVAAGGQVGAPRALLPAPDLSALPDINEEVGALRLDVPPLPGARAYQVEVALDADLARTVRDQSFAEPNFSLPLAGLADGRYRLSVRGVDDIGLAGLAGVHTITVKTQPEPPLYQKPAPGGTVSRQRGELRCTAVDGVQAYRIQLAADAAFTQPVIDATGLAECRAPLVGVARGRYFWRAASVRRPAGGPPDQGPFARPQAVVVEDDPRPPEMGALQSADAEDEPGAHLHWSAEPGQRFRLQVSTTTDFSRPLVDAELAEPAWSSTDLPPGTYRVRIQTIASNGLQSDFSVPRSFRVGAPIQSGSGLPVTSSDGQPLARP